MKGEVQLTSRDRVEAYEETSKTNDPSKHLGGVNQSDGSRKWLLTAHIL